MESLQPDHDDVVFSLSSNRSNLISSLHIYIYLFIYFLLPIFKYFNVAN